jgi:transposase
MAARAGFGIISAFAVPVPIKKSSSAPVAPLPSKKIKTLVVQLKEANEKARLFEAVIDVLKKDYGVRVVKKPLDKSSRKSASRG